MNDGLPQDRTVLYQSLKVLAILHGYNELKPSFLVLSPQLWQAYGLTDEDIKEAGQIGLRLRKGGADTRSMYVLTFVPIEAQLQSEQERKRNEGKPSVDEA